jgi:hypothetical protein
MDGRLRAEPDVCRVHELERLDACDGFTIADVLAEVLEDGRFPLG